MAILLHVSYSLLGIGLVIKGSIFWFDALKYAGALYLAWVGIQALRSQPEASAMQDPRPAPPPAVRGVFVTGFLTNALNPKAGLFFIALFATVVRRIRPS